MGIPQRLLDRQKLQRSAKAWLEIYRDELNQTRPHGLGKDGQSKSRFSPVNSNSIATGAALEAGYEIITNDDGVYEIVFGLPGYILSIDQGIKGGRFQTPKKRGAGGSSPFIKSLMTWIETKHIRTELKTLGLAIAIRRSIFNEGTAPTNIISKINERFLEEYGQQIADDYFESMEDYIIDNMKRLEDRFK